MSIPEDWDADRVVAATPTIAVTGRVWRCHMRSRGALNHDGYHYRSGRFHRGIPDFGAADAWPALYLSSAPHVCLGEYVRHVEDLKNLREVRLSSLMVTLSVVLDCREVKTLDLTEEALLEDLDYRPGQMLAAAAIRRGCEGMVVPSATRFKDPNLIVFPGSLRGTSKLELLAEEDPHLYVEQARLP